MSQKCWILITISGEVKYKFNCLKSESVLFVNEKIKLCMPQSQILLSLPFQSYQKQVLTSNYPWNLQEICPSKILQHICPVEI